jgi:tRNA A-37 threonylcarbamoyl transferase component Bud32
MTTPSICPKCGATIPDGAPQGLCPKCVLLGAATEIQSAARSSKAAKPPTVAELAVHFPELEVLELIGAGGMGSVYKVRQPKLDRLVALKVLSSDLASDPAFAERFDREARLLARLGHPNIVTVFDSGVAGPFAYLLMEFVDGVNLRQAMKAGRFTPPEALALVQDICAALKFAHEQGILHRDIKPENILIDSRGQVKIADFGIAKLVGENDREQVTLTQRGFVLGSPHYMAPEQLESPGDVDQRADIYSLGVVLYELLTGELPLGRFAPPSKKSAVDARIDEIVMRTLERERELRFQTVGEVKTQMQAASEAGTRPPEAVRAPTEVVSAGKTARGANASLICTTLSLAVGIAFLPVIVMFFDMSRHVGMQGRNAFFFPWFFVILIVATAGPGTMLAMRALREIRSSGGRLAGLKRAMFAALAWPCLLTMFMTGLGIFTLSRDSSVSTFWRLLIGMLLLAGGGLGVVMARLVWRWMEQAPAVKALHGHVWRFGITTIVALLCLGAYVRQKNASMEAYLEPRGTKMNAEVTIAAGKNLQFRLVRVDAEGKVTRLELDGVIHAPEGHHLRTTLEIVTTDRWKESTRQHIEARYQALDGKTYSRSVFLDDAWEFNTSGKGEWQFVEGEKQRYELATRQDWFGRKLETLYVEEVVAQNQP